MRSPGEWAADPRIDGVRRWVSRYLPFLATVLAVLLIAAFLPGRSAQEAATEGVASELAAAIPESGIEGSGDVAAQAGPQVRRAATKAAVKINPNVLTFEQARERGVELVANCDTNTGRVMIPSRFAPPCTQKFTPPNGGVTWQGVTDKKIVVAWYDAEDNAAVQAFLAAAGAEDSPEEIRQQVIEWGKFYEAHFNMWGRKVEWHFVDASGDAEDDAAAKADAIKIAKQIKAFAAINSPNNTFVNELVARGVMCFCTVSQPIDAYIKWSPYVWTTLLASSQGYVHRAEYAGKRLAFRKARWANDDINPAQGFRGKQRKFGLLYFETADFAYKAGADFFERHLREVYGVKLAAKLAYNGFPEIQRTQEQARPLIQKLKEAGVTSVLCACDPFAPAFFTQEATRQLYGPEWVITGSALTDWTFFARTYDREQWSHAFGISFLTARLPEQFSDSFRLYRWQYDKEPTARALYAIIQAPIDIMYNGLHMAGPVLTPETFRAGMYSTPIRGRGGITTITQSYGDKGLWPWKEDPVAFDDVTEVWWDPNARGEDEIGQDGVGMYRYVDGGRRYLPSEHPKAEPKAFVPAGTVTIYDKPPPQDQWPCYTSPATKKMDRC